MAKLVHTSLAIWMLPLGEHHMADITMITRRTRNYGDAESVRGRYPRPLNWLTTKYLFYHELWFITCS